MSFIERLEDMGYGSSRPRPYKHFHERLSNKPPQQVLEALNLHEGDCICLPGGIRHQVRKITKGGEVYVYGVRSPINVYSITKG